MLQATSKSKNYQLFITWLFATAIGWGVIVYPALRIQQLRITSWDALPGIAWQLLIPATLLGLIVGILQYTVLRFVGIISTKWILFSMFGYAVGTSIAFLLSATILGLAFPEIYTSNGNAFSFMPVDTTMFLCGGITGLFQIAVLKKVFISYYIKDSVLWVLGSALGWGIGYFSTGYAFESGLPLFLQSGVAGLVIGTITGAVLFIQLTQYKK
jgi:hypothetical protein